MRRCLAVLATATAATLIGAPTAFACGGLVAPNGAVKLVDTTTLVAYHDGVEHYVTSFEYAGGGTRFGSIIPLPGVPTSVTRRELDPSSGSSSRPTLPPQKAVTAGHWHLACVMSRQRAPCITVFPSPARGSIT